MDKIIKYSGIIVLGLLLLIGAGIYGGNRIKEDDGEQETSEEENKISFPFEHIYNVGEDIPSLNVVCHVKEAEEITDYEELDSYYKQRGYLIEPSEYMAQEKTLEGIFPEEVQIIHLNFSLTNHSEMRKHFSPSNLKLTAISHNYESIQWKEVIAFDGKYVVKSDTKYEEIEIEGKRPGIDATEYGIYIQPGETAEIDFVGQFSENQGYWSIQNYDYKDLQDDSDESGTYDLYLSFNCLGTEIHTSGGLRGDKIRLNIIGENYQGDKRQYARKRDIQGMKCRSWTNLEWAEEQGKEALPEFERSETEEAGQQYIQLMHLNPEENTSFVKITRITDFRLIEWEDLPDIYKEQENLQKMAERYKDIYGYDREKLRILLLDISYFGEVIGDGFCFTGVMNFFYENSHLYTKDKNGNYYPFGTADDWNITENSRSPERNKILNMEWLDEGDMLNIQMAYLVPPSVYEQQDALYFFGGQSRNYIDISEDTSVTKIALK